MAFGFKKKSTGKANPGNRGMGRSSQSGRNRRQEPPYDDRYGYDDEGHAPRRRDDEYGYDERVDGHHQQDYRQDYRRQRADDRYGGHDDYAQQGGRHGNRYDEGYADDQYDADYGYDANYGYDADYGYNADYGYDDGNHGDDGEHGNGRYRDDEDRDRNDRGNGHESRYGHDGRDDDDRYDDRYEGEGDGDPHGRRSHRNDDRMPLRNERPPTRGKRRRRPRVEEEETESDWTNRWSSWVPEEVFEEGNDDNSDLEESEFGEEYVDGPRKNQNLPQAERTRAMAETFVDRFKNGGTVGNKTATRKIVSMRAVSEADIPTIKRRLRKSNVPYNILMIFFALVVVGASGYLYNYFSSLSKNDVQMDAITAQFTRPIVQTPADIERVQVSETDMPPIVDFQGLQNLNSEVSSWLRVPGTTIDYPVMTTATQAKYLRLDIEGNRSVPGCLFTDWDNEVPLEDDVHIVIYGHHLPWPAMFHDMSLYLEEPGFVDGHRRMYYETPDRTYVLKVVGVHKAQPEEWQARITIFSDQLEFQQYLDERLQLNTSVYDSQDYERSTITKLFTFITCTDSGSARCIVNAIVEEEYPTAYVPLVRAKMQGLIKADGTIDPEKEAQQQAELQAQQEAEAAQQEQQGQ